MTYFEVVVGNVGVVYKGHDAQQAYKEFVEYRRLSAGQEGRAGGEIVVLMADGEVRLEWEPLPEPEIGGEA